MTTIAWDGKTLAADRAAWSGSLKYRVRKVFRMKGKDGKPVLVAGTGNGAYYTAWPEWRFNGGPDPGDYPLGVGDNRTQVLALEIDSRRRVWEWNSNKQKIQRLGRYQASGGGQEFAMGAMLAGASARQAVRIAIKCSDVAGYGVDTVSF